MSVDQIKALVRSRWDGIPAAEVSLRILDFVASLPADQRSMLTYRTFQRASGKYSIDKELIFAVTILVSSSISALNAHSLFVDDDDREFEIDLDDLREARITGEFSHPVTGRIVNDFESKIIPFFSPSEHFEAVK